MKTITLIFLTFLFCFSVKAQIQPAVISAKILGNYLGAANSVRAAGEVIIVISIDSRGKVISAEALKGHPILRKEVGESVLVWKFPPSTQKVRVEQYSVIFLFEDTFEKKVVEKSEKSSDVKVTTKFISPNQIQVLTRITPIISTLQLLPRVNGEIEEKYCPLHNEKMKTEIVKMIYGLTIFKEGYIEAKEKLFPNANEEVYGGCVTDEIEKIEVYYCLKCRKGKQEWSEAQQT